MDRLLKAISFSKYKCFDAKTSIFNIDLNSNISLIIGRNNCGKSSVIDVIEKAVNPQTPYDVVGLNYIVELTDKHIRNGFSTRVSGGDIGENNYNYGKKFIGQTISIKRVNSGMTIADTQNSNISFSKGKHEWESVANSYKSDVFIYNLFRINADRDIVPESEAESVIVEPNGAGATNVVRKYINDESCDERVVEQTILDELNKILGPDALFTDIRIQQIALSNKGANEPKKWEIFLEERDNRFALSKSGSGLKTILLILINLYLIPNILENSGKEAIFAFEEIENNLHPALQHRLFNYLYDYSINHNKKLFITTHSHIAINTFYGRNGVSIYHVTKNNGISSIDIIENDQKKMSILDDLGVKASDIFQSNGIIWVEGPSDRIYIKRWLEVFCPNDIIEGRDFQFAYYGGRLLAHYTCNDEESKTNELINVLKTNRHAAIVMDSDKRTKNSHIYATKRRIRDEFKSLGSFCWITEGREIENYLSGRAISDFHHKNISQIDKFDSFPDYIRSLDANFANHKVESARNYSDFITEDNSCNILDLKDKIEQLYKEIKKW